MPWILDEDAALRAAITDQVVVTDEKNNSRPVDAWHGWPDNQLQTQSYPFITIDLVDVQEVFERERGGPYLSAPGSTYVPEGAGQPTSTPSRLTSNLLYSTMDTLDIGIQQIPANFAGWTAFGNAIPTSDTTHIHSSIQCLRLDLQASVSQGVELLTTLLATPLTPGGQYTLSMYSFVPTGGVQPIIQVGNNYSIAPTAYNSWQRQSVIFTATGSDTLLVVITNGNPGTSLWLDSVQLEAGSSLTNFTTYQMYPVIVGELPPTPYDLVYQITSFARNPEHDRSIMWQMEQYVTPRKWGSLVVGNSIRRMYVSNFVKRQMVDQNRKRVFTNIWTVALSTELLYWQVSLATQATSVKMNQNTSDVIQSGFTPL